MAPAPTSDGPIPEPTWTDPETCPLCETALPDPGAGFVDHLSESDRCAAGFAEWRERVAGDMREGWPG